MAKRSPTTSSGTPRRIVLPEPVGPYIPPQRLWDDDAAVRLLMILENTGNGARKGERRSVQRVHEAWLLALRGPVANVRAPCLEVGERADRADLEPRANAWRPCLEIVRLRAPEARDSLSRYPARRGR